MSSGQRGLGAKCVKLEKKKLKKRFKEILHVTKSSFGSLESKNPTTKPTSCMMFACERRVNFIVGTKN